MKVRRPDKTVKTEPGILRWVIVILVVLVLSDVQTAFAVNGLQLIGFSAESTALGGSGHIAIADTSSINTNPAALSLIRGTRLDVSAGPLGSYLHHSDVFSNNEASGETNVTLLGHLGFATRFTSLPGLTIGAGVFSQGGFGTDYPNLNTAFGTRDRTSSFFRYLKFAVGASYAVTDELSLGIAPSVGYGDISLRLFPNTSVAPSAGLPNGFAGLDIHDSCARNAGLGPVGDECPSDVVFSVKVGAMYRVLPWLTVGAAYTSPTTFQFGDGRASLNFSAVGLGSVNYDAKVSGVTWPQQVDVSLAARPTDRLLLALTTSWINWDSLNNVAVTMTNPSNPLAPSRVTLTIPFNWKDMIVVGVGASYAAIQEPSWSDRDRLMVRLGYNHSNNPIPKETLSPLAPLILEHHFTGGFGYRFTERWAFDLGAVYALRNTVTYTNQSLSFGPNAKESISAYYVYNTISCRF